jgi:hypothetical protein
MIKIALPKFAVANTRSDLMKIKMMCIISIFGFNPLNPEQSNSYSPCLSLGFRRAFLPNIFCRDIL